MATISQTYIYSGEETCDRERTLDQISGLASETEIACDTVEGFIQRFRGIGEAKCNPVAPVPSGYEGQLVRLRDAVSRLNRLTSDLQSIG